MVEQPDPVTQQYRSDVQAHLVDQPAFQQLPSAAFSPIRTASATSQLRNVTPATGCASCGWWVSTNTGPRHAPP
ncbi:hypothetical protein [Streptomyces sp. NPDC050388]|uniref:hypothetical protein n=1 Tax=Streptomyces sp. NPDC050388 TaxID=3155781 RepID=UPI003431D102